MQDPQRYGTVAIALHWAMAVLIGFNIWAGLAITEFRPAGAPIGPRDKLVLNLHLVVGFLVLLLAVTRLGWRLTHRAPPPPAGRPLIAALARASHGLLYAAMILVPAAGVLILAVSLGLVPLSVFPEIAYPIAKTEAFAGLVGASLRLREAVAMAIDLHKWLAFAMIGLLVIHVAAALLHHFAFRDDVLRRMTPRLIARSAR